MKSSKSVQLLLVGTGLSIIGTFLPWATVSVKLLGMTQTDYGVGTGGGKLVFLLAAAAGVLAVIKQPGKEKVMALSSMICAGLAALITIMYLFDGLGSTTTVPHPMLSNGGLGISLGIGLYLCVAGGLVASLAAFQIWNAIPAAPQSAPPPLPPQS